MNFNARTNVVSECCVGPASGRAAATVFPASLYMRNTD